MENTVSAEDLRKLPHRYQVMFAVFCAEQVVGLIRERDKEICSKALETTKRWLRGEVSTEECRAAARAAGCRIGGYASHAAFAAAGAAGDAAHAAIYTTNAAANAARSYAYAAAYASGAGGAYAAAYAAVNAARGYAGKNETTLVKEQWDYYNELLNLDENLEKILVG
jgi:hypothetical protein